MRVMVFFDLPMESYNEQKEYRKFRNFLITQGFIMSQKSIYTKLAMNMSEVNSVKNNLRKAKPKNGLVQILVITEKQYASIEFLVGSTTSNVLNNTERLIKF